MDHLAQLLTNFLKLKKLKFLVEAVLFFAQEEQPIWNLLVQLLGYTFDPIFNVCVCVME